MPPSFKIPINHLAVSAAGPVVGAAATESSCLDARKSAGALITAVELLLLETVQERIAETSGRQTGASVRAVVVAAAILLSGGGASSVASIGGSEEGQDYSEDCLNHFD